MKHRLILYGLLLLALAGGIALGYWRGVEHGTELAAQEAAISALKLQGYRDDVEVGRKPPRDLRDSLPEQARPIAVARAEVTFSEPPPVVDPSDMRCAPAVEGSSPPRLTPADPTPNWRLRPGDLALSWRFDLVRVGSDPLVRWQADLRGQTPTGVVTRHVEGQDVPGLEAWVSRETVDLPQRFRLGLRKPRHWRTGWVAGVGLAWDPLNSRMAPAAFVGYGVQF